MERLLSGIKPTGELTLGNYIGSIRQFIEMQKNYESLIFVADLHALTVYNDPKELNERTKSLTNKTFEEIETEFKGCNYGTFKQNTTK